MSNDEQKWGDWASGPENTESDEHSEKTDRPEPSERSERSNSSEPVRKPKNVKQDWKGLYVYLPSNGEDEISERIDTEYERLRYECNRDADVSIQKDRHYKPMLVVNGLSAVEEMNSEEFIKRVNNLGFR